MRARRLLATAFLAWVALTSGAFPAMAQDGLERFEKDIKPQLEFQKFTYESGRAQGNAGFVLNKVVAVIPANAATGDRASTIKIDKVTVDELDLERFKPGNDDMPRFAKLKFEGMSGDDELSNILAPYGIPNVPADVVFDYRLDSATKVLSLNKLEITLRGQARIAGDLVIDGISDKASQIESAKDDAKLRRASLTYDDQGLLSKLLPAIAKENGDKAENYMTLALMGIMAFSADQGAPTQNALDAIASFIGDWNAPKGALTIGIKPAKSASLSDLDKATEPNALVDVFGLTASYPGTRVGAAKAGPTAK